MAELRDDTAANRAIRPADVLIGFDPDRNLSADEAKRYDTFTEVIATIFQTPPAALSAAQQAALRGLISVLTLGEVDARAAARYTDAEKLKLAGLGAGVTVAQVTALIDGAGHASLVDLLGFGVTLNALAARIATLEGFHAQPSTTAYLGWSADRVIAAADFAGALSSEAHNWVVPDGGPGYLWYAVSVAQGAPAHEYVSNVRQPDGAFTGVANVEYNGVNFLVFVTAAQLAEAAEGLNFRLEYP